MNHMVWAAEGIRVVPSAFFIRLYEGMLLIFC